MELQEFVSETLVQIIKGVADAQRKAEKLGAHVNPIGLQSPGKAPVGQRYDSTTWAVTENVEFDVAVSAADNTETKGGIGVFVGPLTLGSQGETGSKYSTVSRIKFSVPIMLPPGRNFKAKQTD